MDEIFLEIKHYRLINICITFSSISLIGVCWVLKGTGYWFWEQPDFHSPTFPLFTGVSMPTVFLAFLTQHSLD